jgi:hypothetical protein
MLAPFPKQEYPVESEEEMWHSPEPFLSHHHHGAAGKGEAEKRFG